MNRRPRPEFIDIGAGPAGHVMADENLLFHALAAALRTGARTEAPPAWAMARQAFRLLGHPRGRRCPSPAPGVIRGRVTSRSGRVRRRRVGRLPGTVDAAWVAALRPRRDDPPRVAVLIDALARIAPGLHWTRRPSRPESAFDRGHANALLVRPGRGAKITVGLSLLAAGTRYPDHDHWPRELYFVLRGGRWFRSDRGWIDRRAGQWIHNPPNAVHAMCGGQDPLLAVWFLRLDGR